MIKEDEILTLLDDKQYYVMDSIMYKDNNYIMITEFDEEETTFGEYPKIMVNDYKNDSIEKVTEPKLLYILINLFAAKDGALND